MNAKILIAAVAFLLIAVSFGFFIASKSENSLKEKIATIIEKPLEKYTFENLQKTQFVSNTIVLGRVLEEEDEFISQIFYFDATNLNGKKKLKKISGLLNVPKKEGVYPVILMVRGFVPKESFTTGIGTKRAGEVFAKNGFITLAPDFLGYGESDPPSNDPIEERFETYTTLLSLFASLGNLDQGLLASYSGKIKADTSKVGLWGHSNGGQIALSTLAISGKTFPTCLWAPVSKSFPYSVLYFTDDFDDHGKALRKKVAEFEKDYDAELYSPTNFYSWINAPLQIHQGENDDAVPKRWSDQLVEELKKLNKDVEYFVYPNSDHNLMPGGWAQAVDQSINFYNKYFKSAGSSTQGYLEVRLG